VTILTYLLAVYVMACIAVYAVVRATISDSVVRGAFLLMGCSAPFFAIYVLASAAFSKDKVTSEEADQISQTAKLIEQERQRRFGNIVLPSHRRLKIEYVRALNRAAETIERVVERTA
jgi:hypothetical protein